jgi:hypothetical protein
MLYRLPVVLSTVNVSADRNQPTIAPLSPDAEAGPRSCPADRGMGQRRSLREVMPSLVNTLPRCHSTVRGLMNNLAAIS